MPTVMDKLKGQIKDQLSDREFKRLQRPLEIIERNREIRAEFKRLRRQGVHVREAIYRLTEQSWNGEYMTYDAIDQVIYPRKKSIS